MASVVDVALAVDPQIGATARLEDFREAPREILETVGVAAILPLPDNLVFDQIPEILAIDLIRVFNEEKVERLSLLVTWIAKILLLARNLVSA